MNILMEKSKNAVVLHVKEKRLDAHNSGEFKSRMTKLIEDGTSNLIIDLAEVSFIDSSGLGALLSGYKNVNSHQGNLMLSGLQSQVRSLFELTRLHRVFSIYPSLEEAQNST
jgi:anti-sigma B factor antagonist